MKIVILDQKVRRNLELFRHLIHRQAEKENRFFRVAKKAYDVFVNKHTGELNFSSPEQGTDWKAICIQLRPNHEGAFEIVAKGSEDCFAIDDLDAEAFALLSKTIHLLNQLAYDPKQGQNPFWVLKHISHIDFVLSEEEEGQRNLIHEAWHNCNRFEAETLLADQQPGTYLFRKDEFAKILEDEINEEALEPVLCITLSSKDEEGKVLDKTLVYEGGGWQIYNDDPNLCGARYSNVKDLLHSIRKEVMSPLLGG